TDVHTCASGRGMTGQRIWLDYAATRPDHASGEIPRHARETELRGEVTTMQILGHRGAKGEAPENTLAGFAYAKQIGLDAIELDVRLTKDDQVVIMHDPTVDRTTNGQGAVGELTFAELHALDARADFPEWPAACSVP